MITLSRQGRPEPRYPECKEWKEVFTTHNRLTQGADVDTNGKEYRVTLYPAGEAWVSYFDLDEEGEIYSYIREFLEESYGDAMDYVGENYGFSDLASAFMEFMDWSLCCDYDASIDDDDLDRFIEEAGLKDEYPTKRKRDKLKNAIRDDIQKVFDDYYETYQKGYDSDLNNLYDAMQNS